MRVASKRRDGSTGSAGRCSGAVIVPAGLWQHKSGSLSDTASQRGEETVVEKANRRDRG